METVQSQLADVLSAYNQLLGHTTDPAKVHELQHLITRLTELQETLLVSSLQQSDAQYHTAVVALDEARASARYTLTNLSNLALGMEKANTAASSLSALLSAVTGHGGQGPGMKPSP